MRAGSFRVSLLEPGNIRRAFSYAVRWDQIGGPLNNLGNYIQVYTNYNKYIHFIHNNIFN